MTSPKAPRRDDGDQSPHSTAWAHPGSTTDAKVWFMYLEPEKIFGTPFSSEGTGAQVCEVKSRKRLTSTGI